MRNLALMWVLAGVAVALLAAGDTSYSAQHSDMDVEKQYRDILVEAGSLEVLHKSVADWIYVRLLRNLESGIHDTCPPVWSKWRLNTWGRIPAANKNIDSVTARFIAVNAAEECSGYEMTALSVWPMGSAEKRWAEKIGVEIRVEKHWDEDYWVVICIPTVSAHQSEYRNVFGEPAPADYGDNRYNGQIYCYDIGILFMTYLGYGLKPVAVLISKKNGQVLSMEYNVVKSSEYR
jgi:hypothetical protein